MIFGSSPQAEVGSTGLNGAPAEGKADPSHSTHTWYLLGKGEQDKKNVPQVSSTAKSGAARMAAPPLQQGEGTGGWWWSFSPVALQDWCDVCLGQWSRGLTAGFRSKCHQDTKYLTL